MGLLQDWREYAYGLDDNSKEGQMFWGNYFSVEKGIYEQLLSNPDEVVTGTLKELAQKYDTTIQLMTGFLDGIEESLKTSNHLDELTEDTEVSLDFDLELLYKNMVECEADWLYNLEQWDDLISVERRKELYKEQKSSKTVVKPPKIGRNDPCPCGSGRKYKQCCGKN